MMNTKSISVGERFKGLSEPCILKFKLSEHRLLCESNLEHDPKGLGQNCAFED